MPFKIIRNKQGKYQLYNIHKELWAGKAFNTKQSAINQGLNYMRYRHERGKVVGNIIQSI